MRLRRSPRSPHVRKVMIADHEKGLAERPRCVRTAVPASAPAEEPFRDDPLNKPPTPALGDGAAVHASRVVCGCIDSPHNGPKPFPPGGPPGGAPGRRCSADPPPTGGGERSSPRPPLV